MEEDMEEVTARQVAGALGMPARTVVYWIKVKGLKGWKPFDSDRAGYRTTIGDVRRFLRDHANDDGRTLDKFNAWVKESVSRRSQGLSPEKSLVNPDDSRTGVLCS